MTGRLCRFLFYTLLVTIISIYATDVDKFEWTLNSTVYNAVGKPVDLGLYPHDCVGALKQCWAGFTLQFQVSQVRPADKTSVVYLVSSGGQTPLSDGFFVRQNYGLEFEVGVAMDEQMWLVPFWMQLEHTNPKDSASITITWIKSAGLNVYVDGMLVGTAEEQHRLFVPYKYDPYPRIVVGLANNDFYLLHKVEHVFAIRNVIHWNSRLSGAALDKLFAKLEMRLGCLFEAPNSATAPEVDGTVSPSECLSKCSEINMKLALSKAGYCKCEEKLTDALKMEMNTDLECRSGWSLLQGGHSIAPLARRLNLDVKVRPLSKESYLMPNETVLLEIASIDDEPETYTIDFGDGETLATLDKIVPHEYRKAGIYKVKVEARTRTLRETKTVTVNVTYVDEGIPPEMVRLFSLGQPQSLRMKHQLVVVGMGPIECKVNVFEATAKKESRGLNKFINTVDMIFRYPAAGLYHLKAVCKNRFGQRSFDMTTIVKDFEVRESFMVRTTNLQFQIRNAAIISDLKAYLIPGFGNRNSLPATIVDNDTISVEAVERLQSGQHVISIEAAGRIVLQQVLYIQDKIKSPSIVPDKPHTLPGEAVTFNISIPEGDMVFMELDYGDGYKELMLMDYMEEPRTFLRRHRYKEHGVYHVVLTMANDVSHETIYSMISIERIVDSIYFNLTNVTRRETPVVFNVHLDEVSPVVVPYDLFFDYGDGTPVERLRAQNTKPEKPFVHQRLFPTYGNFIVTVTAKNNISSVHMSLPIKIGQDMEYVDMHTSTPRVTTSQEAVIEIAVPMGMPASYQVDFGDGQRTIVNVPLDYMPDWSLLDATTLKPAATLDNSTLLYASDENTTVIVHQANETEPELSRRKREAGTNPDDMLSTAGPAAAEGPAQPIVEHQHRVDPTTAPPTTAEPTTEGPKELKIVQLPVNITVTHRYALPGQYRVKVRVQNPFTYVETWLCPEIDVFDAYSVEQKNTTLGCSKPPAWKLANEARLSNFTDPYTRIRSVDVPIDSSTTFDCKGASQEFRYTWRVMMLHDLGDNIFLKRPTLEMCVTASSNSTLLIPKRTLPYGHYIVEGATYSLDAPLLAAEQSFDYQMIESPLVADVAGAPKDGSITDVIFDESITFDMRAGGDPDVTPENFTALQFQIYCFPYPYMPDVREMTLDELEERSYLVAGDQTIQLLQFGDCFQISNPIISLMHGKVNLLADTLVMDDLLIWKLVVRKEQRPPVEFEQRVQVWLQKLTDDNQLDRIEDLLNSGDTSAAINAISKFSDSLNTNETGSGNTTRTGAKKKNMRGKLIGLLGRVSDKVESMEQVEGTTGALGKVTEVKEEVTFQSRNKASGAISGVANKTASGFSSAPKDRIGGVTGGVVGAAGNVVPEMAPDATGDSMFALAKDFKVTNIGAFDKRVQGAYLLTTTTYIPPIDGCHCLDSGEGQTTPMVTQRDWMTTPSPIQVNSSLNYDENYRLITEAPLTTKGPTAIFLFEWTVQLFDKEVKNKHGYKGVYAAATKNHLTKKLLLKVPAADVLSVECTGIHEETNKLDFSIRIEMPKANISDTVDQLKDYLLGERKLGSLILQKAGTRVWAIDVEMITTPRMPTDITEFLDAARRDLDVTTGFVCECSTPVDPDVTWYDEIKQTVVMGQEWWRSTTTTTTTTETPIPDGPEAFELDGENMPDEVRLLSLLERHPIVCKNCGPPPFFNESEETESLSEFFSDAEIVLIKACAKFKGLDMRCLIYYEDPGDIRVFYKECKKIQDEVIRLQRSNEKAASKNTFGAVDNVGGVMMGKQEGNESTSFGSPSLALTLAKTPANESGPSNQSFASTTGSFSMPAAALPGGGNSSVATKFMTTKGNPFTWSKNSGSVQSGVVSISYVNDDGSPIGVDNTSEPMSIKMAGSPEKVPPFANYTMFTEIGGEDLNYHRVAITENDSSLHILLQPLDPNDRYEIYVKYMEFPNISYYDFVTEVPNNEDWEERGANPEAAEQLRITVFPPPNMTALNGSYVLGVRLIAGMGFMGVSEANHSYALRAFTSGCRFWDEQNETWASNGCVVGPLTTIYETECLCTHLTSFGGDFVVPPNTIDFNTVWAKFGNLGENAAVFSTVISILGLYIFGLIWCRAQDKKDLIKWGAMPLEDNLPTDEHHYLVSVCTGWKRSSGTESNVSFILSGEDADSGVRQISDGKRKGFPSGSILNFILATEQHLGSLQYLRIWHDNSGKGKVKGWYLDSVVVTDLQSGRKSVFLNNRWLAVEEDDGAVERIIPVAGLKEMQSFGNLFGSGFRKKLSSEHLWFSIMSRPTRSHFTRCQRVTCALSLLFLTMIANCMFFKTEGTEQKVTLIKLGPFSFTMAQLFISTVSTLIVFPPNLLLVTIFRKAKPRSNAVDLMVGQKKAAPKSNKAQWRRNERADGATGARAILGDGVTERSRAQRFKEGLTNVLKFHQRNKYSVDPKSPKAGKKKQKPFTMPWWTIYFGWVLAFFSVFVSAFFVILYSMEWGKEKSNEWLITFLTSFFQSVIIVQPIKVLLLVAFVSMILKKPQIDEEDEEGQDDEVPENKYTVAGDEELMGNGGRQLEAVLMRREMAAANLKPPDTSSLEKMRQLRQNEIAMEAIMKEVITFLIFIGFLFFISYQTRSSDSHPEYNNLMNLFVHTDPSLSSVQTQADFYHWARNALFPSLFAGRYYNGQCLNWRDAQLIADKYNFRVGVSRFRQLRVKNDTCKVTSPMDTIIHHCRSDYNWFDDDASDYKQGWGRPSHPKELVAMRRTGEYRVPNPWYYQSSWDLKGLPYLGTIGFYKGGGYAVTLARTERDSRKILNYLERNEWITVNTRAVFTEFNLYNPNVNLFASVVLLHEFLDTGGVVARSDIKVLRLFNHVGSWGVIVVAFEIITVCFIIYFMVKMIRELRKQRLKYFKNFWNVMDFATVVAGVFACVMYIMKLMLTYVAIEDLKASGSSKFVNFVSLAQYDEIFAIVIAVLVFLSTLKIIKLLKFNKRMSMLGDTIRYAGKDLKYFVIIFAIYYMAFISWGFLMFGRYLSDYKGIISSAEALFAFSLGSFDFAAMTSVNPVLGVIYFFMFIMIVYVLLMAIFMTIICDAVTAVKEETKLQKNDYEIVDFIWKRIKSMFVNEKKGAN